MIPVGPVAAFGIISLWAHRHRVISQTLTVLALLGSFILSLGALWTTARAPQVQQPILISWFTIGSQSVNLGLYVDPTAVVLLAMVSFICLMVAIYSVGYLRTDRRAPRFYAYVSLFAGAMLGAVICDNLLALFVCWEIMGACSYLLIGFWWERTAAMHAALKAFLVTKVGDLFLLLGLVVLYAQVGSLAYVDVFSAETLARLGTTPILGSLSVATLVSLLLFGGTIGKSAQLPLHLWLPDAMEGPTPASALIHAATMVSAGVYLLIRAFPLLQVSQALPVIAVVGTLTALFGSVVALAQHDIKRVLAFSTISQLGYMVAAVGIGAYAAGLFHLVTHAFFKALLFLAAGSVIHGIEHGHRHVSGHAVPAGALAMDYSPNDMWRMGGLAFRMPVTALTFTIGSMALAGLPLITSGFWSKDEILAEAWAVAHAPAVVHAAAAYDVVFWGLLLAAALTAFYAARQVSLIFLGAPRARAAVYAQESAPVMVGPLTALALFAIVLGWLGIPSTFPLLGRWLPNSFGPFVEATLTVPGHLVTAEGESAAGMWLPLLLGAAVSLAGLALGWWVYGRSSEETKAQASDPLERALERGRLGGLWRAMHHRFYIDGAVQAWVVAPMIRLADLLDLVDRRGIDRLVVAFGQGFGQTGRIAPTVDRLERGILDRLVDAVGGVGRLASHGAMWVDRWLIGGLVSAAGGAGRLLSALLRLADIHAVDGTVEAAADTVGGLGRWMRRLQSGILSDYLWNAFMVILLLVAALVFFQRI